MAELNDFMTRIDLSVVNDYVAANGKSVVYAKGERIVQQGRLCRYVGVVQSGYFKYVALNSKGQEVVDARRFIIERNPGFVAEVSSNLLQEAYCRYLNMLVKTPAERFHELVSRYPGVIHNLPIQEIASYLGISRRQLHRIREAESASDAF